MAKLNWFPADATLSDLKRRYLELAKEHHPDAGGDAAVFAELAEQYRTAKLRTPPEPCGACEGMGTVPIGRTFYRDKCPACEGRGYADEK